MYFLLWGSGPQKGQIIACTMGSFFSWSPRDHHLSLFTLSCSAIDTDIQPPIDSGLSCYWIQGRQARLANALSGQMLEFIFHGSHMAWCEHPVHLLSLTSCPFPHALVSDQILDPHHSQPETNPHATPRASDLNSVLIWTASPRTRMHPPTSKYRSRPQCPDAGCLHIFGRYSMNVHYYYYWQ